MNKKSSYFLSLPAFRSSVFRLPLLGLALALLLPGCTMLEGPEPQPTPTPVPPPPPTIFDPTDGIIRGIKLNDPANEKLPDSFQVTEVLSPELIAVKSVKGGAVPPGPPEVVRVAGIVAPLPGQPGFDQALLTTVNWTRGEVSIDQDPTYPNDFEGRRNVHVFFTGTGGETEGQELSLNRMLVRSGHAVVDLHAPSTFTQFAPDQWTWFNDEQYARQHRLGLWGRGIILGQRLPPPAPEVPVDDENADNVTVETGVEPTPETPEPGGEVLPDAPPINDTPPTELP